MAMLAEVVEVVIGVDTHKHPHTAAVVAAATGATTATMTVATTPAGYQQLLELADQHHDQRVWAIEGTGGYGAGLTRSLAAHTEQVVELDRARRAARRHGAKSDPLDATRAVRQALGRDQLAQPRATGPRASCRCGWPPAAQRSKPPATPNASSAPSSLPHPRLCAEDCRLVRPTSWWRLVPTCASGPSPYSAGPPPSPPPAARPSGFGSTALGTVSSTRPCPPWS
jgi:Transposase